MTLEICAYDIRSCFVAELAGAHRIELCAGPAEGGVTPSFATYTCTADRVSIPAIVMVRPRGGNFVYEDYELEIMERDIRHLRDARCPGIVTGVQLPDGRLNEKMMRRLRDLAYPMAVTCHKVFDGVPDLFAALDFLVDAGYDRVLTSGGAHTAKAGSDMLKQLVTKAGDRIKIMPGGGIRSSNLADIMTVTGAREYHSSGLLPIYDVANQEEIAAMTTIINSHNFSNTN